MLIRCVAMAFVCILFEIKCTYCFVPFSGTHEYLLPSKLLNCVNYKDIAVEDRVTIHSIKYVFPYTAARVIGWNTDGCVFVHMSQTAVGKTSRSSCAVRCFPALHTRLL